MNNTDPLGEIQDCPDNPNEFLPFLSDLLKKIQTQTQKNTAKKLYQVYCKFQKAVQTEFTKCQRKNIRDLAQVRRNVLRSMERIIEIELGLRST